MDLSDEGIFGGVMDTYVVGVNWYPNNYSRILMNYSHHVISEAFDVSFNGADGKNIADTVGIRFQLVY